MATNDKFLAQLEKTSKRFSRRADPRESAQESMSEGDFLGANTNESVRDRLKRLGMGTTLTEQIGTNELPMPSRAESDDMLGTIANTTLERILGDNDLMPVSYLTRGFHCSRSIGRIHIRNRSGQRIGFGTGFLVSPSLLLTNNHVLDNKREASSSIVEFDFEVDLNGDVRPTVKFPLDADSFFITDEDLDFTLVTVKPGSNGAKKPRDWGWNRLIDEEGLIVKGEYVSIIQHPNGETKQIAMRENRVIDLLDDFTHYKADTAPGSSGSPVFNDQWEIVALHHSGVPARHDDGDIMSIDGGRWNRSMGDHRIKWIANEGVSSRKIIDFVKKKSGLNADQRKLRDALFDSDPPPTPRESDVVNLPPVNGDGKKNAGGGKTFITTPAPIATTTGGATWTIPLQVTVNVGGAQMPTVTGGGPGDNSGTTLISTGVKGPGSDPGTDRGADPADLQRALDDLQDAQSQPYFDADKNEEDRDDYYSSIDPDSLSPSDLFNKLSELLESTHKTRPRYKPSTHVYPFVDLHPDLKIRSIYSGKSFEAEELIREDFRIEQERAQLIQELALRESDMSEAEFQEELDFLEAQNPFNCEHVVPQSWYEKKEPMRGDLHHLFACESGCNSFRGNLGYFDFSDFDEATRTDCGKRIGKKFEPGGGKGPVARATLYFLIRYPSFINDPSELPEDRISMLLKWHGDDGVTEYELHRNQAIFAKQGNRNPLIDHPDWAGKIRFAAGLG